MSAASDDLTRPLAGSKRRGARGQKSAKTLHKVVLFAAGGVAVAVGGFLLLNDDPLGGEPYALAPILEGEAAARPPPGGAIARIEDVPGGGARTGVTEIEARSGVSVVRPEGGSSSQAIIISVPQTLAPDAAVPPRRGPISLAPAPDPRLMERTRHGELPVIGLDGARAFEVYARPAEPAPDARARVAIVVTGLGISQSATAAAIGLLPADVTLAFAPYGTDLQRHVERARESGHEVMLQAPMEPFDFPNNDPGPHTLRADLAPQANRERLQWVMGRFTGYIGIVNFMGARFTADEAALTPMLKELADRGLGYLDDGTSARSLAPRVGASLAMPVARASVLLDPVPRAETIDAALRTLEEAALRDGSAIATASGLPISVERIVAWAEDARSRGIVLVPVSSLMRASPGG